LLCPVGNESPSNNSDLLPLTGQNKFNVADFIAAARSNAAVQLWLGADTVVHDTHMPVRDFICDHLDGICPKKLLLLRYTSCSFSSAAYSSGSKPENMLLPRYLQAAAAAFGNRVC
jgi:hypothetical protein